MSCRYAAYDINIFVAFTFFLFDAHISLGLTWPLGALVINMNYYDNNDASPKRETLSLKAIILTTTLIANYNY